MTAADMDIVMKSIHGPSCVTLCESLDSDTVRAVDPEEDVPSRHEVLNRLPEHQTQRAVTELCITLFDNLGMATGYI